MSSKVLVACFTLAFAGALLLAGCAQPAGVAATATPTATVAATPTATPAPTVTTQLTAPADWALPNKDYSNARVAMQSSISSANVDSLGVAWSFPIPGTSEWGAASTNPLIIGNTIYFQDLSSNVFAIDLASGSVKWSKTYNMTAYGPNGLAVANGKIFIMKGHYDIAALDMNGNELWDTTLSTQPSVGIDIQPIFYDGLVYVSTVPGSSNSNFYTPGGIGFLYALDANTGRVVWNFSTVDTPDIWGNPQQNSGGGSWYPPSIDQATGTMYWGVGNPAPWPGTKEFPNGASRPGPNLYTDSILAIDHSTGKLLWYRQALPHDLRDYDLQIPPVLGYATIGGAQRSIVIAAGKMGKVFAFDRATGESLWNASVGRHQNDQQAEFPEGKSTRVYPGPIGGVETPMALSNGILYVPVDNLFADYTPSGLNVTTFNLSAGTGELVALSVSDGRVLWDQKLDSLCVGGATVVNDLVFTATADGTVFAFDRMTGNLLAKYSAPAGINAWPAVVGDTIVWPAGFGGKPSLVALRVGAADRTGFQKVALATQAAAPGAPSVTVALKALKYSFNQSVITVPAGANVTIVFSNEDTSVQHNFALYQDSDAKVVLFKGPLITGASTISYNFAAPTTPGAYFFRCDTHPQIMTGQLVVT